MDVRGGETVTVRELIDELRKQPPDQLVKIMAQKSRPFDESGEPWLYDRMVDGILYIDRRE